MDTEKDIEIDTKALYRIQLGRLDRRTLDPDKPIFISHYTRQPQMYFAKLIKDEEGTKYFQLVTRDICLHDNPELLRTGDYFVCDKLPVRLLTSRETLKLSSIEKAEEILNNHKSDENQKPKDKGE